MTAIGKYRVTERTEQGERIHVLHDDQLGLTAEIVPGVGAQCHRLEWTVEGKQVALLDSADCVETLRNNPYSYGIPLLFPFPNRVAGGSFTFSGTTVQLPINEPERNNALHGFIFDRRWTAVESGANDRKAWITCTFSSMDNPALREFYPFSFTLQYTLSLRAGRLETEFRAMNIGDDPMPMGFGVHPWFPLPLSNAGTRQDCRVKAPTTHVWELDNLLPTGQIIPPAPERDIHRGIRLGDLEFDDVYTNVITKGPWEATYSDPASGIEIGVISSDTMRELVLYAPSDRGSICLEPYSCTTNAFNLETKGVPAGLIELDPHDTWTAHIHYVPRRIG